MPFGVATVCTNKPVRKGWKLSESQKEEIYLRANNGEGPVKLGREFGVTHGAIQNVIKNRKKGLTHFTWKPTLVLPKSETDLAYIAGLADGEGSFYKRTQDGHWYFKLAMTDKPIIEWLASFGGTFHIEHRPKGYKTPYTWSIARRADLRILIEAILPYLKVKYNIAKEALESLEE